LSVNFVSILRYKNLFLIDIYFHRKQNHPNYSIVKVREPFIFLIKRLDAEIYTLDIFSKKLSNVFISSPIAIIFFPLYSPKF